MAPAYLKERFGDRLAFHGCISTPGRWPTARWTDGRQLPGDAGNHDARRRLLLRAHPRLQDNSPTENVVAMYEVARSYGRY